jgi:two-component system sensor histidine kinase/response regulator
MTAEKNRRILVVDDDQAIREDFRKVLAQGGGASGGAALESARMAFLGGDARSARSGQAFDLILASQGEQAVELLAQARAQGRTFALAFVDVRMPPGIDGLQTIKRLWDLDPDLQVVICTAFSDYSFEQIIEELGSNDRLLILKKPFDPVEVRQLAGALTEKWNVSRSDRTRMEELRFANLRAEAANRAKSEFLANMSHEIRTPMNALVGYVDLLCDPEASEDERQRYAGTIRKSSEHLLTILNDILDISHIEASRLVLNRADVSPIALAREVLALMQGQAAEHDLELTLEAPLPIPEVIETDLVRARQILINLISNAIKFTPSGGVRLVLRLDSNVDSDHRYLCFDVIDTGIGIAPDKQAEIFDAFSQADTSATRQYGGTGLGLAISKRLAVLLGGDVEVTSEVGQGSTFTLRVYAGELKRAALRRYLPDECRLEVQAPAAPSSPPAALTGRVLVVEDVELNQRLLAAMLRQVGLEVELAENGQVGYERTMAAERVGRPFDLIVMDMQMPVLDGYEATRRLRAEGYRRPVLALTAHAMANDRERCLQAGCDAYETKPIRRDQLLRTCRALLLGEKIPGALGAQEGPRSQRPA